ncbi:BglG family transcription antiterminator [Oceanobacillus locisalsi]|uniref:Ascorbate-specific PTS system EIIA component n=1 Tax=Oceanobacillus locisalsi TaxID=546107 RepID=A0ABW3NDG7_9BACI
MFDQRSYALYEELTRYDDMTKSEVMRKLSLSERQFNYDFEKMNNALISLDMPRIEVINDSFVIDSKLKEDIGFDILVKKDPYSFIISEQDRIFLIYLYTFIREEQISNYHYQLLLDVSKNTALADVKKIKKLCSEWGISLVYTRMEGYHLKGSELDKRRLASYCIGSLLAKPLGKEIIILALKTWEQDANLIITQQVVDEFLTANEINLVKSRKKELIILLTFVKVRGASENLFFNEYEKELVKSQQLFEQGENLSRKLINEENENESYYITIQLLTALEEISAENPSLEELSRQIIDQFEKLTLLPIENKDNLKQSLYNHLVPAFFRITFRIPLVNSLTTRIKEEYSDLFQFVKRSLAPLSKLTGKDISEEEIGYFTLHFGGYLEKDKRSSTRKLRALVVCSNGVSSSIMLRAQLNEMFSDITFSKVYTSKQIADIATTGYDLIFSTVDILSVKPVYIVKPLLSQVEKNYLLQQVASDFPRYQYKNISVDSIMSIINKYADIKNDKKLYSELVEFMYLQNTEKGRYSPMLSELLTEDMIHFTDDALDWKEAITKASQPLLEEDKIQKEYIDAMIKNVEETGTYIHIGKGIAIPHARPEAGVNNLGMSFLRTKNPVLLLGKEEHKIDIFICLAAIDSEAHLKALAQLTRFLSDDTLLQSIKEADTSEKIIEIIKKGEEDK